ncbi:cupin domain-containing protein [Halorarum halobium]|uniref:cupin domain-containing protein n=1 Tax=Halorarum halobium TaxID=3075121 RepID=UPI0028AD5A7D|nr:cupin domain-containing protein [Halobaculum sp. XH14]
MEHVPHGPDEDVEAVAGVHLSQLAAGEEMNVQHFTIDPGAEVPSHSHPHEQSGIITAGTLTFRLDDGETVTCEAGDSYVLAGGETHGVVNDGEEPVTGVDVFSPPRTDPDWADS